MAICGGLAGSEPIAWGGRLMGFGFCGLGFACISISAITAAGGFALTATHFSRRRKVSKRLCPSIRCLAVARHALTPALLRGPAAIGHPWPGAATAASLPRCPLRNACVRPLGKGQQIKIKINVKSRSNGNDNGKINSFASKPAPTVGLGASQRDWLADRTPSLASQAPTIDRYTALASHHSSGRALARLQLLILMHRPLERPSGGSAQWATRQGCRVSRPRPWMAGGGGPTEQDRSEGMPSHSEAPNERGKRALVTLVWAGIPDFPK